MIASKGTPSLGTELPCKLVFTCMILFGPFCCVRKKQQAPRWEHWSHNKSHENQATHKLWAGVRNKSGTIFANWKFEPSQKLTWHWGSCKNHCFHPPLEAPENVSEHELKIKATSHTQIHTRTKTTHAKDHPETVSRAQGFHFWARWARRSFRVVGPSNGQLPSPSYTAPRHPAPRTTMLAKLRAPSGVIFHRCVLRPYFQTLFDAVGVAFCEVGNGCSAKLVNATESDRCLKRS